MLAVVGDGLTSGKEGLRSVTAFRTTRFSSAALLNFLFSESAPSAFSSRKPSGLPMFFKRAMLRLSFE